MEFLDTKQQAWIHSHCVLAEEGRHASLHLIACAAFSKQPWFSRQRAGSALRKSSCCWGMRADQRFWKAKLGTLNRSNAARPPFVWQGVPTWFLTREHLSEEKEPDAISLNIRAELKGNPRSPHLIACAAFSKQPWFSRQRAGSALRKSSCCWGMRADQRFWKAKLTFNLVNNLFKITLFCTNMNGVCNIEGESSRQVAWI